jgi:uridine kinase
MADEFDDAIAAATEEAGGEPEPEPAVETPAEEVTPEEPPKEAATEEEPAAEAPTEETPAEEPENEFKLSAEDLKTINDSEELKRAYKSLQRGATEKFTSASEKAKAAEEAIKMIDYIRANPDKSLEEMAEARGFIIAKKDAKEAAKTEVESVTSDTVEALMEKYSKELGPESTKLLFPFMKEVAEQIVKQNLQPISERTTELQIAAKQRGISAAVHEFGASVKEQGEDWNDEIISDMAAMMDKIVPGDQTSMPEYLSTLYNSVTAQRSRTAAVRAQLTRLKKAEAEAEPTHAVRPAPKEEQSVTTDMSERDAIALATALAEKEARAM